MKRIEYIDIAKGIAILLVVVGHTLCYGLYGFEYAWKQSKLMQFIYSFHMPLFMFLSGLVSVTAVQKSEILQDVVKRLRALIVPFLVIGAIYSMCLYGNLHFIYDEMKFGYWYLWVLFFFYIATYPICIGGEWTYLLASFLWILVNHYIGNTPENIKNILSLNLMVQYYPYYLVGNMIKRYKLHHILFDNSYVFLSVNNCLALSFYGLI